MTTQSQTYRPFWMCQPDLHSNVSPGINAVVSRGARTPVTCGWVGESAQATIEMRATAPHRARTRDFVTEFIERSIWGMRSIYPALN
jgi:hypothetical protein